MLSVMIVEDDISVADILASMLRFLGCTTRYAPHPKAALELLTSDNIPDLFLVDYYMPYLNGPEFCQVLKEDPRTAQVPVVLLSAERTPTSEAAAQKAGAAEYLLKPVMLDDLKSLLTRVIKVKPDD